MANELDGKVVLITGAASGIGLATAETLMREGATVVMADRNEAALTELVAKSRGKAIAQVTDLLDAGSCAAMIPEVLSRTGQIDILHCNAGIYIGGDLVDTDAPTIDRMLNLNINAVIKNVHAVLPHMIERGSGDIVVTSSLAGRSAIKHEPVYSASKWAITCFTRPRADRSTSMESVYPGLSRTGDLGVARRLAGRPAAGGQGCRRSD